MTCQAWYCSKVMKRQLTGGLFKIGFDMNLQGQKNNAYASVMEC